MAHDLKVEAYKSLMSARGVPASTAIPPLWRLLWATGIPVPPPPFLALLPFATVAGSLFAILLAALLRALAEWGSGSIPRGELAVVAPLAGAFFGASLGFYYRSLARRHRLGAWSAFPPGGLHT